jgi:membrane associated rhomboid family serine protease
MISPVAARLDEALLKRLRTVLVCVQLDGIERTLALADFEDLVRLGTVGPHTPVRIDAVTHGAWVEAGTLALYQGLAESGGAHFRRAWERPAIPWATATLCGLAVRGWLWSAQTTFEPVYSNLLARSTPAIFERGETWRLVTYAFVHANLGHIGNNVLLLLYTGFALESFVGTWSVLALFVVSSVVAGLYSGWLGPEVMSVGASGADFGFIAGAVVFGTRYRDVIPLAARARFGLGLFVLMVWALVNGAFATGVDNQAHFGGILAGAAFVAALRPAANAAGARWNRRLSIGALLATAVVCVGLAFLGPRLVPFVPLEEDGLRTVRPAWWEPGWTRARDSAWVSPVGAGSIGVHTLRLDRPQTVDTAVTEVVDSYRTDDTDVRWTRSPIEVDGVGGARLTLTADAWSADVLVLVRGHYVHVVSVEAERPAMRAVLLDEVVPAVHLTDPKALDDAVARGDTPRARVLRARALADLGRTGDALAMLDPADPTHVATRLGILADVGDPTLDTSVTEALARFPEDRRVWAAAVAAQELAGSTVEAATLRAAARAKWPGERAFGEPVQAP